MENDVSQPFGKFYLTVGSPGYPGAKNHDAVLDVLHAIHHDPRR